MVTIFRVNHDPRYARMRPSQEDLSSWMAKMTEGVDYDQSAGGVSLQSRWNENWSFALDDVYTTGKPLGDFSSVHKMIVATNEPAFDLLRALLHEAAETLRARLNGQDVWMFNVVRQVEKDDIRTLDEGAVFRVNPTRARIYCGSTLKDAVEGSGLKGLAFRPVSWRDKLPLV